MLKVPKSIRNGLQVPFWTLSVPGIWRFKICSKYPYSYPPYFRSLNLAFPSATQGCVRPEL